MSEDEGEAWSRGNTYRRILSVKARQVKFTPLEEKNSSELMAAFS